jgi:hypothetical protein
MKHCIPFYVYTLAEDETVFYVGKGRDERVYQHEQEARKECECQKCKKIRDIWARGKEITKTIVFTTLNEPDAYIEEAKLIASIGLCNLTNIYVGNVAASIIRPIPATPILEMTEDEYIISLKSNPYFALDELPEAIDDWRRDKLNILQHELRYCSRRWTDEQRAIVQTEITTLRQARKEYQIAKIGIDWLPDLM